MASIPNSASSSLAPPFKMTSMSYGEQYHHLLLPLVGSAPPPPLTVDYYYHRCLLNFIMPDVFGSSETFDEWFNTSAEGQDNVVTKLHQVG